MEKIVSVLLALQSKKLNVKIPPDNPAAYHLVPSTGYQLNRLLLH